MRTGSWMMRKVGQPLSRTVEAQWGQQEPWGDDRRWLTPALVSPDLPFWALILICLAGLLVLITGLICCLLVAMQAGINLGTAVSRGLYQPATIFMGRQMSAIPSAGDVSTEQKSPQPTKNFRTIPDPRSQRQTSQSSDVTDSYVVCTNSGTQCLNKSDKIDGRTSLQIGEKTPVTASPLSEEEQTHCLEIGSNSRHGKSNLSESKKSPELHSLLRGRLRPGSRTTDLKCDSSSRSGGSEGEILTREHIEVKEDSARLPVAPISVSEYCASENHPPHRDPEAQKPFRKMQQQQEEESLSSSSDLTLSVSEDDLILESPEPQPNPSDKMEGEDGIEALKLIHSEQERGALSTEKHNCILQTLSSPDSKKESSTNSPTREHTVYIWSCVYVEAQEGCPQAKPEDHELSHASEVTGKRFKFPVEGDEPVMNPEEDNKETREFSHVKGQRKK